MTITRLPETTCPACGTPLSAAGSASHEGSTPSPGDVTVCALCATVLIFDQRLVAKEPTAEDLAALFSEYPYLEKFVNRLRAVIMEFNSGASVQ